MGTRDRVTMDGCCVALIGGRATAGRFALIELTVERGAEPPCHRHANEDEVIYVLAGDVHILVGTQRLSKTAGGAIFIPRGVEHGFAVVSGQARLLTAYLPAGFEGFYRETADAVPGDLDRLIATAARYGCEVTGPPLTVDPNHERE
jgi:quercetin dioxygenase-like cupin family protein